MICNDNKLRIDKVLQQVDFLFREEYSINGQFDDFRVIFCAYFH